MHVHASVPMAPAPNLNDNLIVGNKISGNAADTEDAATPGPTGINLFSVAPVTGTIIALNSVTNQQIDIAINTPSADVEAHLNNLQGQTGIDNIGAGTIDATDNYWSCAGGPGANSCSGIIGMVLAASYSPVPF